MTKIITFLIISFLGINYIQGQSATFTSTLSGAWSSSSTWSITSGSDANGIPDSDDDVIITSGFTVTLSSQTSVRTFSLPAGGRIDANNQRFNVFGDFTITGGSITNMIFYPRGTCNFSSTGLVTGIRSYWIYGTLNILAGTTISSPNTVFVATGKTANNFGNVFISGGLTISGGGTWINNTNSNLYVSANISTSGNLNATATGNTITYRHTVCTQIRGTSYYNLVINAASSVTRTATSNITVLNNFTLASGSQNSFSLAGFNMTVGGNWSNAAGKTILNQGTITFNTTTSQTISRTSSSEQLDNVIISGTGTTVLGQHLFANQNLTINNGSTLDLSASNFILVLKGDMVNDGTLNCRSSLVRLGGTTNQAISGTSNTQFYNLTLINAAGAIINSTQSVTNDLTVTTGNFNSNGNLILVSDASKTARIAPVGASGSFTGNMIIQKFISGRVKGWHDLSSPTQGSTIFDWDDEMYMSGFSTVDNPAGISGVDGSAAGFKSVYTYNEATGAYAAVTNSNTTLTVGQGYEIWLADDQVNWNAKTIDARGVPSFGTKTISCTFSGPVASRGSNLIGNPFASAIDYALCTKTNLAANVQVLDNSGNLVVLASGIIPSHQGFWVTATAGGASLVVPESAKSSDLSTDHYRTAENYGIKFVFSSSSLPYYHENTINFEPNTSLAFDADYDAQFIKSPLELAPYVSMGNDKGQRFILNTINGEEDEVVIPLTFYTPLAGTYNIQPNILNNNGYNYIWLENTKTGKKQELGNNSIVYEGKENTENTDYVLHLSKKSISPEVSQNVFVTDLAVFNTSDEVNIKAFNADHLITKVVIYSVSGQIVYESSNITIEKGGISQIDISNLTPGMYIVNVIDNSNNVVVKKIIR